MKHIHIDTLKDKLLVILALFMLVYTGILVYCQSVIGVSYWDIFVYLQDALLFANINIGSQLSVPPVLSLLTSIPFRLGFISETSMFIVSGVLFFLLIIGVYELFNEKYSPKVSFIGSIILSMLSLIVTWAVSGSNDAPALTFSVWAIYFTIQGLNKDFKYYYLAFILFVFAFFTRFTEGFILLVMLCYLGLNHDKFHTQCKENNIFKLIAFMIVTLAVIMAVYLISQGSIPFLSQFVEVSNSNQVSSVNVGYELNPFYYLQHLPEILTCWSASSQYSMMLTTAVNNPTFLSYVMLLCAILGVISFIFDIIRRDESIDRWNLKFGIIIILSVFTMISYTHISYIFTELLFIGIMLLSYKFFPNNVDKLDIVMFIWMGIFLIMHSYHPVKVDRYIMPTLIPLLYFMIKGIQDTTKTLKIKNKKTPLIILTIILLILIPINANYISSMTHENPHTHEEKQAAQWLQNYDENIDNYNISSDRGVSFSWYLKKYTYSTIPRVLEANNDTLENKLNTIHAKYYIDSTSKLQSIKGYHVIYDNNKTTYKLRIYERD